MDIHVLWIHEHTHGGDRILISIFVYVHVDYDLERPRVHKRIPSGDFMCTTNSDGEMFYIKLKDEIAMTKEVNFLCFVKTKLCLQSLMIHFHSMAL